MGGLWAIAKHNSKNYNYPAKSPTKLCSITDKGPGGGVLSNVYLQISNVQKKSRTSGHKYIDG